MTFEELVKAVEEIAGSGESWVQVKTRQAKQETCYACKHVETDRKKSSAYDIYAWPFHVIEDTAEAALAELRARVAASNEENKLPAVAPISDLTAKENIVL